MTKLPSELHKERFEDYEVACELEDLDPFRNATAAEQGVLAAYYKRKLEKYDLEILSIAADGIRVFPKGSRVKSQAEGDHRTWLVPNKHIYTLSWGVVYFFLDDRQKPEPMALLRDT